MKKFIRVILIAVIFVLGMLVVTTPFRYHQYGVSMQNEINQQLQSAVKHGDNFMFLGGTHCEEAIENNYKNGEHIGMISDMQGENPDGAYIYFAGFGKQNIELNIQTKDSGLNYFFPEFKLVSVQIYNADDSS